MYLKKIDVPTLIMVGELDTLTPPSMSRQIKREIENSSIINYTKCWTFNKH